MTKFKQLIMAAMITFGLVLAVVPAVGAVSAINDTCADPLNKDSIICKSKDDNVQSIIKTVVDTLLFLIGVASVIVIIFGAITYTTSAGSSEAIKKAKDMILYAIIGLVVAISAYAIVSWVTGSFDGSTTAPPATTTTPPTTTKTPSTPTPVP